MRTAANLLATSFVLLLSACGGTDGTAPGSPTAVGVAAGSADRTAVVSFTAPTSAGSSAITGYTVTASPGGLTASGSASPITLTGLTTRTAYIYSVVANNAAGSSAPATSGALRLYSVVQTFREPMTQPNDSIFTGTFTFDTTAKVVSNLQGSLTESMTKNGGVFGPPMTTVTLANQLSSAPATLGGVDGLLVTTFFLTTVNTFDPSGFAPGGSTYYGFAAGAPNPKVGGVGNAYAMIFVNTADPTAAVAQAQLDKMAYADCTAGGMMMTSCMTGTTVAGYGTVGTMKGYPFSQVIAER
ncbi:MAG: fibronectin type III domain-containing protein [Deltaproteobacteria bacterium]